MAEATPEQASAPANEGSNAMPLLMGHIAAMVLVGTIVLLTDVMPGLSIWNMVVPAFTAFVGVSSMNLHKLEKARASGLDPRWRDAFPMFLLFTLYFWLFAHAAAAMHLVPIIDSALPSWPAVLRSGYASTLYMTLILVPLAQVSLALDLLLTPPRT